MTRRGTARTGPDQHRRDRRGRRPGRLAIAAGLTGTACAGIALTVLNTVASGPAATGHGASGTRPAARVEPAPRAAFPAGFWSGSDSTGMALHGRAPARLPGTGAVDGGYIGMAGNWATWQGCKTKTIWSRQDARAANTSLTRFRKGIGTGVYWFMGGPGVDPHYNGTTRQASRWGGAQAARALHDIAGKPNRVTYPVVFMDVELPGHAPTFTPADDNGWNNVYTSPCSGRIRSSHVAARVDHAELSGFAAYLAAHSRLRAGVYSSPEIWPMIFGRGRAAQIPHTYEWTYHQATASLARRPGRWCLHGTQTCARFFGGVTTRSRYALMWQWSGGGGTWNGFGDFDQIDGSRTP